MRVGAHDPRRLLPALASAATVAILAIAPAQGAPPPGDTTPPETAILSGPSSTTASTTATFTFASSEERSSFECSLDGARLQKCSSPKTYNGLTLGAHAFSVQATDHARNTDPTPATWTWTIGTQPPDTVPPETTIVSAPPSSTTSRTADFSFTSSEAGTFQCSLDGSAFAACSSPKSYNQLATGSHTFRVRAVDTAGNVDPTPAHYTWTIQAPGEQVSCGQVLTRTTTVGNDLVDCAGDGLVVGSDNMTIDLNGYTIDGVGLGAGVRNEGFSFVTVRNGTIQQFDQGVLLGPGTQTSLVEDVTALDNQVAGIELTSTGTGNQVRDNSLVANGTGIALLASAGTTISGNTVSGTPNIAIVLEASSGNTLLANTVSEGGDGGIDLSLASNDNRLEGNVVTSTGDAGISVTDSDGNELVSNTAHGNSDAGIALSTANGGVVSGNDVRFNPAGIELLGSSGNRVESNNASSTTGIGIEVGSGSLDNDVLSNVAGANAGHGIYVADEALLLPGNLLDGNTASGNGGDGIHVAKGGHTISDSTANSNVGWGIFAEEGNTDGGRNSATGNGQLEQCFGVDC
jgi:parallel beta-helix repeat protein